MGRWYLHSISQVLSFKSLEVKKVKFHYGEKFLEVLTHGIQKFLCELQLLHPNKTATQIMHWYKDISPIYELLYLYNWHLCPYWHTRAALKSGNSKVINSMWRYWLPLFISCKKTNYAIMSMRFLWMLRFLDDSIVQIINQYRIYSFTGQPNTGIPLDGVNELVWKQLNYTL